MIYNMDNVLKFGVVYYEKLENHPEGKKFRAFCDPESDDYDYVESPRKIKQLTRAFEQAKEKKTETK
jgi:hypothetical protein